jgi:outer membrane protein TolC
MKAALQSRGTFLVRLICALLFFETLANAEPITLKRAVELALSHSTAVLAAGNDQQRAFAALREARNQYIPQAVVGSGLGASWGFPLSLEGAAPSVFNVNAQSAVINPALHEFIHAARDENGAATLQAKDQRLQVTQDTVVTYSELVKWEGMLDELNKNYAEAQKDEGLVRQRIEAGVDGKTEEQKAQLATARARLRALQAQGAIDVLRDHLAKLTGLASASIATVPDSVPELPAMKQDDDLPSKAADSDPALQAAQLKARAQLFRARGEHRSLWPSLDFAAQYAVLARYNNYDQFYKTFERNNATVGVAIRFPFLNFSQRAHAQVADADALRAKNDVQSAHSQLSEQARKLQHSVEQLSAAQEVADLEFRLAQSNIESVNIRMNSGGANIHDAADARTEASEKYNALQNTSFELLRARIGLLRASGELESWVQQGK